MSGKKILVTGAGRGAGWGIAMGLAEPGNTVVVCDLDPDTSQKAAVAVAERGAQSMSIPCDVSDEGQVNSMFEQVHAAHGALDVLVNTVAWIDPPGSIADLPTDRWDRAVKTNLYSVMFCTRAALREMITAGRGVIINVSSLNGTRGFPDRPSYGATKAAVINFTQTTAMENRQHGIRANVLVPGGIAGERVRILGELMAQRAQETGQTNRSPYPDPQPELLDPEWIGRYVAYLVSDDGRHINGQALVIGEAPRSPLQAMFPDL